MTAYVVKPHVRAAADSGGIVFLDVARDAYLSIPVVKALEPPSTLLIKTEHLPLSEGTAQALIKRNLIEEATGASPSASLRASAPDRQIAEGKLSRGAFFGVLRACMKASDRLKRPFHELTSWVRPCRRDWDESAVADLCASFDAFRIYHPRQRICLFDSIALIEYLNLNGVDAHIVFGARTRPFEAHCWVERDGVTLNERVARARSFQTLMMI